jgi:DNA-binding protein H-NS
MSVEDLLDLRSQIERHLTERKADLEKQLTSLGGFIQSAARQVSTTIRNPLKGRKVPIKYRGPERGQTWTGRGVHPKWLAALVKQGRRIEEFSIGGAKQAVAAAKTVAKKVARKPARKEAAKRKAARKG